MAGRIDTVVKALQGAKLDAPVAFTADGRSALAVSPTGGWGARASVPATLALFGVGLAGLGIARRRLR